MLMDQLLGEPPSDTNITKIIDDGTEDIPGLGTG